jgi:serine/threonine protein kinase
MELVHGVPITEYCDQCNLPTRERLELFVAVCQAVQHAHQKGIIHRDIKPTNVLVAMQDGRATPKVIDFGVAKAMGGRLTEHTLTTGFAQMVGTPLYMSPEQAELSPLGVDTRSDIYSLGVLLYELLTGATPFDRDRLHAAPYDEVRRIIREEEAPRPSSRINTLAADAATTVAEHRRTDARRLRQTVRGELDWIVMKCLEKDRNRRYETANGLARDIERYLNDEPVQACPPSASYRLKKFVRRNKIAAAFVLLLVAAVAALTVSNIQTRRNERRALTESARAQAVSDLLQEILASSNPDQVKGSQYTVRELLDDFSAGLGDQLAGEREVEAAIRSVIGKSYWRLGVFDRAELHSKKALDLRRQVFGDSDERVADSLVDYAWNLAEQYRYPEAETHTRDALSIYRKRHSNPRATVRALWSLQEFLHRQSRYSEAEQMANEALALAGDPKNSNVLELPNVLHTLADSYSTQGKYEEAEKWARQAVEIHRRLQGNQHPETAWGLWALGTALRGQQKLVDAEPLLREALSIFREYYTPEHCAIQGVRHELASVLWAQRDRAGLETLAKEQAEHERRLEGPGYHVRLAELLLANESESKTDEARQLIWRAMDEYGRAAVDHPNEFIPRLNAAIGFLGLIRVCEEAPGFAAEVENVKRRLTAELPQLAAMAQRLTGPAASADGFYYLALIQLRLGDRDGYRATCQALIDLPDYIGNDVVHARPIWTLCIAPNSLDDLNRLVTRAEGLVAKSTSNQPHFSVYVLGAALYRAGRYKQAAERLEESVDAYSIAPSLGYDTITYQQLLLAMAKWQLGQKDEARQLLAETLPVVNQELASPLTGWNRWVTLEILQHEAESLIVPIGPEEAGENAKPNNSASTTDD